jgi:translocation and assembly module TamB
VDSGYALDRRFNAIILEGRVFNDSVDFQSNFSAPGVELELQGNLVSSGQDLSYEMNGRLRDFNIRDIVQDSDIYSDINCRFDLRGSGTRPEDLTGSLYLNFDDSIIDSTRIDTADIELSLADGLVSIGNLQITSPLARLTGNGSFGLEKRGEFTFELELPELGRFSGFTGIDSIGGEGLISGRVDGALDSLQAETRLDFTGLQIEDNTIKRLQGELHVGHYAGQNTIRFDAGAQGIRAFGLQDLELESHVEYRDSTAGFSVRLDQGEDFQMESSGDLHLLPGGYRLMLQNLGFVIRGEDWRQQNEVSEITWQSDSLKIDELLLMSGEQILRLSGDLDSQGAGELQLEIDDLDINRLSQLLYEDDRYYGRLDFNATIGNDMSEPQIKARLSVDKGGYFTEEFDSFSGDIRYDNEKLNWDFVLSKTAGDSLLRLYGYLPYQLAFSPFSSTFLQEEFLEIHFITTGVNLSFIQGLTGGLRDVQGTLVADIVLKNRLQDLRGSGPIRIVNGRIEIPEFGVAYEKINLVLLLDDRAIRLQELNIESGGGDLQVLEGSLAMSRESIEEFSARLQADNFRVVNTEDVEMRLGGILELSGSIQAVQINGDLSVDEAVVYYPAFTQQETAVELTDKPFFVIWEDTTAFDSSGALRFQKDDFETAVPFTETDFYKNVSASVSLNIDRNTWLRSEEANVEIQGEVDLQKKGVDVLLFGTVSTVRGYYELQGNRFEISEGKITFRGDPDYNPQIQIRAVHEFTQKTEQSREKHELQVLISGSKEEPRFDFTLDNQPVEQKDVFSILLFGKPFDSLAPGQRSNVSENSGFEKQAAGFLTGQLIKSISSRLSSELNLDVLQIESGRALGDTKVRVGKYVTPDVFVSVSQDFSAEGNQKVKLEYALPRDIVLLNLFLQAMRERRGDTGVDVIWKYEW